MQQLQKAAYTSVLVSLLFLSSAIFCGKSAGESKTAPESTKVDSVMVHGAVNFDVSPPLALELPVIPAKPSGTICCSLSPDSSDTEQESNDPAPAPKPV